jgi:hypothetical protein
MATILLAAPYAVNNVKESKLNGIKVLALTFGLR